MTGSRKDDDVSDSPIPVAVVGAGNMGVNHARVYDELPGAELVEVVEPDPERASQIREQYGVAVRERVTELEDAQATTVAVPNDLHRPVAKACIDAGLDVLVEKPLATTVRDAEAIVEAADAAGAVLLVGHIERFNPAVGVLSDVVAEKEVVALEAHRLGPFNEHLSTESVVMDLLIHDVDVIRSLVDSPIRHVDAVGAQTRSEETDHAIAHLKFENNVLGTATASHLSHRKVRTLAVTAMDLYATLDYQQQDLTLSRREMERTTVTGGKAGYRTETIQETPFVPTREPLKNELEHFIDCVRTRDEPKVGRRDGVEAVRLASAIVDAIESN